MIELFAEIIEVNEKPVVPVGVLAENPSGEVFEVNEEDFGRTTFRGIIDVGLLGIQPDYLIPQDQNIEVVGASSDMLVLDLKSNSKNYKVGDLGLLNSSYIEKVVE